MTDFFYQYTSNKTLEKGLLLLSEPFLNDNYFTRSVILICDYNEDEGCFGLVLNQLSDQIIELGEEEIKLHDHSLLELTPFSKELFIGGPVDHQTLVFIHKLGNQINGSVEIDDNVFIGGDLEDLIKKTRSGEIDPTEYRLFLGYSGWSKGQLEQELKHNSWIVCGNISISTIFDMNIEDLWKQILNKMGGSYKKFANYPIDPNLN